MDENLDNKPRVGYARNAARNLLKLSKIITYPIKLIDIAKCVPDLNITGVELEEKISGMQGTYRGISFIRYNTSHSTKRNRFTVAHELGHAILGHTVNNCNRGILGIRDTNEIEANQFSAELLIPLEMLKTAMKTITTVNQLARIFWVSKDAMGWRVKETGQYKQLTSWN